LNNLLIHLFDHNIALLLFKINILYDCKIHAYINTPKFMSMNLSTGITFYKIINSIKDVKNTDFAYY